MSEPVIPDGFTLLEIHTCPGPFLTVTGRTMTDQTKVLVERLREGRLIKAAEEVTLILDGRETKASTGEIREVHPLGTEAADTIEALTRERDAWRARAYETADDLVKAARSLAVKDEALEKIDLIIFGNGAPLGGENYFAIREAIRAALNHKQEV